MSNLNKVFGTQPQVKAAEPEVKVGDLATICYGRDRKPGKVAEIVYTKNGKIKGYMVQQYAWTMDAGGYATEIHWDRPLGEPALYTLGTHGRNKGKLRDCYIGYAQPFYDLSF